MLIDTHVHLNLLEKRPHLSSTMICIVPATKASLWHDIDQLASSTSILPAYGLHPWFKHEQADLDTLERIASQGIAIGECGLDKMRLEVKFSTQLDFLHAQLEIANTHNLPVILHCVKAGSELLHALKQHPTVRGVVHGYSSSAEEAKQFIDKGFYLGIPHVAISANALRIHAVFKQLPLSALLLESDAPNKRFASADSYTTNFKQGIINIADNLSFNAEELIEQSNENAQELFSI